MNAEFKIGELVIETERLILRKFRQSDLHDLNEYASVLGVGEMAGWKHHETIEETQEILDMFIKEDKTFAIVSKNNNKGISLVSLIIIIVATIILISVVVTVGYDYIEESNRAKIEAVVKLIGDAAKDKQDEMHQVDSDPTHYIGYPLKPEGLDKISGLPDSFEIVEGDVWYFIDANSAKELGVVETEKYIE